MLADEAERGGYDGIVCGHIHKAELRQMGPILYANCGDWVESCTALVEDDTGRLHLIDWARITNDAENRLRAKDGRAEKKKKKKTKKKEQAAP